MFFFLLVCLISLAVLVFLLVFVCRRSFIQFISIMANELQTMLSSHSTTSFSFNLFALLAFLGTFTLHLMRGNCFRYVFLLSLSLSLAHTRTRNKVYIKIF